MRFGGLVAVNDLSFSVGRGDITASESANVLKKYVEAFEGYTYLDSPTNGHR